MSALRELVLLRVRSFVREPEAVFWTFGFPILLTIGLGLAFREEALSAPTPVAVEQGTEASQYAEALAASGLVRPLQLDSAAADHALRSGEVPLWLTGTDTLVFRFDPARSESREARLLVDRVIQGAAGGTRPVVVVDDAERQPGKRYTDWLIPGLIGLNLMSTGMWGIGFGDRKSVV